MACFGAIHNEHHTETHVLLSLVNKVVKVLETNWLYPAATLPLFNTDN